MNPSTSIIPYQDATLEVAIELTRLAYRLSRIASALPLPADVSDLLEWRAPATPASYLFGTIRVTQSEVQEAGQLLLKAAQVDEVSLRDQRRREQERRRRKGGRR
jgi:hypothetical protein